VAVVEDSGAPVTRRGKGDFESAMLEALPIAQFMDPIESQIMHEIADMFGDGDGLVAGYCTQRAAIQMIEMRVGDQDEINGREIAEFDPGMLDPLDHLEPSRPIGINEHAVLGSLNEKGGVSNPRHANFPRRKLGKYRLDPMSMTPGKQGGNDDLGKKVPFVPSVTEPHVNVITRFCALSSF